MASGKYRNLDNQAYWKLRSLEIVEDKWKDLLTVEKELKKQYRLALKDTQDVLQAFYQRYADEHGLSYAQAMLQLNRLEVADYGAKMATLQKQIQSKSNPFAIAEMEKLVAQFSVQRLTAMMAQIDARLIELGHVEQMNIFTPWLSEVYESTYYKTGFSLAAGAGLGNTFTKINERAILEAISYPWSGQMFSERIWFNRQKLVRDMRQVIVNGLIKGSSVQSMSRELKEKMNASYKNSLRLIRTETAEVLTSSTAKGYEEYGVEEYMFLATLDNKTSSTCRNLDLQIFKVKDKQSGTNAPPMHPNCRSSIAPYFDGINLIGRWSKLPDGEKRVVERDISYKDWHQRYVK